MSKRSISERVDEFKKTKPDSAKLMADEWEDIRSLGNMFDIIVTAFYYGYMKGSKAAGNGGKR